MVQKLKTDSIRGLKWCDKEEESEYVIRLLNDHLILTRVGIIFYVH